MINFRYHLVSLIAVFLALAVGLVLGAGALKGPVSDELSSQVSQLRDRNDQLREEAATAGQSVKERDEYLNQGAAQLVGDLMPGQAIAIVSIGGVSGGLRDAVTSRLTQAGASIAADARLPELWWSDGAADAAKQALAELRDKSQLPTPSNGEGDVVEALNALGIALTDGAKEPSGTTPPSGPTSSPTPNQGAGSQPTERAQAIAEVLKAHKLLSGDLQTKASGIVILAEKLDSAQANATSDPADIAEGKFGLSLAQRLAGTDSPTVLAGPATWSGDAVSLLRSDEGAKVTISSVDNVEEVTGQLSVPRALAATFRGVVGHYGTASNATGPLTGDAKNNSSLTPPYVPVVAPVPSMNGSAAGSGQ